MQVTQDKVLEIFTEAMLLILKLAGPLLAVSLIIGLLVSVFQAATQIHEQTLTFVPKAAGVALTLLVLGSYMLNSMIDFVTRVFDIIAMI